MMKNLFVRAVPLSMLDSLERRGDREAPGIETPKDIVSYYNEQLDKVDPNGEQALKSAREMYKENL